MKFTLATIAIAAVGVYAVEFNGDAHLASFRKAMTKHESHPRRLATRAQNVLTSAASARKFDTLGAVPGAMSDECMAAFTDAMSGMEDPAVSSALASPDAAGLAGFCASAVFQDFQTAWAATEAACTADELGENAVVGLGMEIVCLKVDGEYCMLQFGDTTGSTSGEDFECLDGLKSVSDNLLCDGMDDCADGSDETHASCPTAAEIEAETAAACENGGGCLWEIIKMGAAMTGEDTTVLEVMMDIQCLRGSDGEYCANVGEDEMCTSTCQRDTLNTFFALVDADEEKFCAAVVTVDGEDDVVTDMEDSLESSFDMFCADDAGATMLTFLEINCMANADGELCKDVMEDSPGGDAAVCPEDPCGETTCSTACEAEMQSYADVAGCCASKMLDIADSVTSILPEVGCALAFFDTCGVSFTPGGCTENELFVENGGISAGAGGLDGITLADGSTLGAGVRAQFSLFSVVFAALAVAFHA